MKGESERQRGEKEREVTGCAEDERGAGVSEVRGVRAVSGESEMRVVLGVRQVRLMSWVRWRVKASR